MMVSQEIRDIYHRDGVVKISGAIDPFWVEFLRQAVEDSLNNPGPLALEYADEEKSTRFFGDQFLWTYNDQFKKFILESEAAQIAGEVMQSQKINMFFDHLLVKEPGSIEPTPWHQDAPYWKIRGEQICSIWYALDDVTEESGGVRYVKGSHANGKWYQPQSFTGDNRYESAGLDNMPDIDATVPDEDIICYELKAGDCLVHHANIIHGAKGNVTSQNRRRGYASRWTGDDVVWDPRVGTADIIADPGLESGAALDSDLFPVIWRRDS